MTCSATYSPEDNKLRLYSETRLDLETYQRVKAAGFKWAPQQSLFVAPMWTPGREDLLLDLAGEIADEDMSLVERAEDRSERFSDYSDNRTRDAEQAHAAVHRISDNIPLGQPILVGHHSEKHARRDAEKIQAGMRKAVRMWDTAQYWQDRAAGAIRHAKHKERPDVRARRIKGLEADKRKREKSRAEAAKLLAAYLDPEAIQAKLRDGRDLLATLLKGYHGGLSYEDQSAFEKGEMSFADALDKAKRNLTYSVALADRWIAHYSNRLEYERAMLADSGGTVTDRTGPEVGGAVQCWASPGHGKGWAYITKVNKVTVTIMDKPPYGERLIRVNMPFDKLHAVMTRAEVEAARAGGRMRETEYKEGFFLLDAETLPPKPATEPERQSEPFEQMRASLKAGVKVVSAPQLFPTPPALARQMVERAGIVSGRRVLEPSAGTGNIIRAIIDSATGADCVRLTAVEINYSLAAALEARRNKTLYANESNFRVLCRDFLTCTPDELGLFHAVIMNPPFCKGQDIAHIVHALKMLAVGGTLVAICANGPNQQKTLRPLVEVHGGTWEPLPAGTFEESGTGVNAAMLTMTKPEALASEPVTLELFSEMGRL